MVKVGLGEAASQSADGGADGACDSFAYQRSRYPGGDAEAVARQCILRAEPSSNVRCDAGEGVYPVKDITYNWQRST